MLNLVLAAAFAAEPPSADVAAAFVAHPPDLGSCFEGIQGTFSGEAVLKVSVEADGKISKVAVDHTDAAFPEDCGLSVLRELSLPAGARTLDVTVEKSVPRSSVTYGPRIGGLRLEAATRPGVLACALATPSEAPDPATGAVIQYIVGPSGKVVSAEVAFGAFTGEALTTCVLGAYRSAKLPKTVRNGAIIVWEPLRWTAGDLE